MDNGVYTVRLTLPRIVRGRVLGPVSRFFYGRSAVWTFGEEAIAETFGAASLRRGLAHPVENGRAYFNAEMFGFDAAVLAGISGASYGLYEAVR